MSRNYMDGYTPEGMTPFADVERGESPTYDVPPAGVCDPSWLSQPTSFLILTSILYPDRLEAAQDELARRELL